MRGIPKPLSSQDLQRLIGAAAQEGKIVERAHESEKRTDVSLLDAVTAFKEDFVHVCLPGYIKVVCK
jgi:hypothetical protein